jgi:hypothetical protein
MRNVAEAPLRCPNSFLSYPALRDLFSKSEGGSKQLVQALDQRSRRGFLSTLRSCTCGWLKAFAKESPSAPTSM